MDERKPYTMTPPTGSITRMLTVSSGHVSENTAAILDAEADGASDLPGIAVYHKDGFGWFVYVDAAQLDKPALPEDLRACVKVALNAGCGILCLDSDGQPVPYLPLVR